MYVMSGDILNCFVLFKNILSGLCKIVFVVKRKNKSKMYSLAFKVHQV